MGQPAVPRYVTQWHEFADCPPGHRFNFYFDGWNERWGIAEGEKANGLRRLLKLGDAAVLLDRLRERQAALAENLDCERCVVIEAESTSPFATGLGNEHPIENGFAFLTPYGLPYLAGSGLKGTLRRAAEDLGVTQTRIDALFGPEDPAATRDGRPLPDAQRRRGALVFWDSFPEPQGGELVVEIMTPHYSDYYQGKSSPHDAGQPNPIPFLAVPAGSRFRFVVTFEPTFVPPDASPLDWKEIVRRAFEHAFEWLGFGGKTAVGYGALKFDLDAEGEREKQRQQRKDEAERQRREAERQAALAALDPVDRAIQEFLDTRPDKNQSELSALLSATKQGRFDPIGKAEVAKRIRDRMQAQKRWREKSEAKKPEKDRDYQDTLLVKSWLEGK